MSGDFLNLQRCSFEEHGCFFASFFREVLSEGVSGFFFELSGKAGFGYAAFLCEAGQQDFLAEMQVGVLDDVRDDAGVGTGFCEMVVNCLCKFKDHGFGVVCQFRSALDGGRQLCSPLCNFVDNDDGQTGAFRCFPDKCS